MVGLVIIVLMALFSFVGPLIYPTNQSSTNLLQINLPPSSQFPLGTDPVGYNILGRLMVAGRPSLEVGTGGRRHRRHLRDALGRHCRLRRRLAGRGHDADRGRLRRHPDRAPRAPSSDHRHPQRGTLILILGFVSWLITARLVRSEVLVLRTLDYVKAAEMIGERPIKIVYRHLVRNVVGTVAVQSTFEVANAILLLAALSFLGLGPPPPAANWGEMLTSGLDYIFSNYWWQIYPAGLCIVLTVVAFNLLGDAVRDTLEVRLAQRGASL